MEENPPRVSRRDGSCTTRKSCRYTVDDDRHRDGDQDLVECSGKYCKSCTAGLIADCVALCCCPCAVVNFLALAFVKVPYMMGRKCLGVGKKKVKKRLEMRRKGRKSFSSNTGEAGGASAPPGGCGGGGGGEERDEMFRNTLVITNEGILEILNGFDEEEQVGGGVNNARYEAERVWLELYQVGHLGFGRVSFTGVQISE